MQLTIDIGNSNIVLGLGSRDQWRHVWRLPTLLDQEDPRLFYEVQLSNYLLEAEIDAGQVQRAVLSSVVPDLTRSFQGLVSHLFKLDPILVGPEIYPHLPLRIERPNEIGTDLLANAMAVYTIYRRDAIIVDFGTALTFTAVDRQGAIIGVSIAPGLKTAIGALYQKTAQLPEVPLEMPASAIGRNTTQAIQSGILVGYVGLVSHMLTAIRAELGEHYVAIATGGLSSILHPLRDQFYTVDPHLTLNGLQIIGERLSTVSRR